MTLIGRSVGQRVVVSGLVFALSFLSASPANAAGPAKVATIVADPVLSTYLTVAVHYFDLESVCAGTPSSSGVAVVPLTSTITIGAWDSVSFEAPASVITPTHTYNFVSWSSADGVFSVVGERAICLSGIVIPTTSFYTANYAIADQPPVANPGGPYTALAGQTIALDGSASFDPDRDAITFTWDLDSDGSFGDSTSETPAFTAALPGNYIVRLKVVDAFGLSDVASATVAVAATDTTAPSLSCSVPDQTIWHASDVSVTCTGSETGSGLADPGDASFVLRTSVSNGTETSGAATGTRVVCDLAGNCTTAGPYVFKIDRKAPPVTCNAASFVLNQSHASVTGTSTDGGSGPASQVVATPADTSSVGTKSADLTAMDGVGNATTQSCPYDVGYQVTGFFAPVNNPSTVNTGKAGRTYPMKWQLRDANATYISGVSAVADVVVKATPCSAFTNDPTDALETSTSGGSLLRYDSATNQYVYNWATPAVGCYTVFIKLASGQTILAFFVLS